MVIEGGHDSVYLERSGFAWLSVKRRAGQQDLRVDHTKRRKVEHESGEGCCFTKSSRGTDSF